MKSNKISNYPREYSRMTGLDHLLIKELKFVFKDQLSAPVTTSLILSRKNVCSIVES